MSLINQVDLHNKAVKLLESCEQGHIVHSVTCLGRLDILQIIKMLDCDPVKFEQVVQVIVDSQK